MQLYCSSPYVPSCIKKATSCVPLTFSFNDTVSSSYDMVSVLNDLVTVSDCVSPFVTVLVCGSGDPVLRYTYSKIQLPILGIPQVLNSPFLSNND